MDLETLKERYLPLIKEHWIPISLGFLGISLTGYGLMQSFGVQRDSSKITFQSAQLQTTPRAQTAINAKQITVDIEGSVMKPGIHKLPIDSRVEDALLAAGGMSEKADHLKVAKGMNLAAKAIDGGKMYIPFVGEVDSTVGQVAGDSTTSNLGETAGVVNINTASETELDSLPGVGPTTAQKIISARPFASVEELVSKKAVGKSVFEKIKEKVVAN